jgi:predicted P-loop ATPase
MIYQLIYAKIPEKFKNEFSYWVLENKEKLKISEKMEKYISERYITKSL